VRHILKRCLWRVLVAAAMTSLSLAAPVRAQNPVSDNVVFLHGLYANEESWKTTANRLAQEYNFTPHRYAIDFHPTEAQQAQVLATDLTSLPANMAGVGKSNGSIVLRT
jgi:hypothetical protein